MKFGSCVARVVLATALATAIISGGCEKKSADSGKAPPAPAQPAAKK
jgi:hypothetical protein